MNSSRWLFIIQSEFTTGASACWVKDGDVNNLHSRLRRAARRRGWCYRFKKDKGAVMIYLDKSKVKEQG